MLVRVMGDGENKEEAVFRVATLNRDRIPATPKSVLGTDVRFRFRQGKNWDRGKGVYN